MPSASQSRQRQTLVAGATIALAVVVWLVSTWLSGGSSGDDAATGSGSTSSDHGGSSGTDPVSGLPWIARADLPPEAIDTLDEIDAGPPYKYDRDGITFENREGILPDEDNGYYEEFTVDTPGSDDRGARRVILGDQDELYYTDDHYESFSRIAP